MFADYVKSSFVPPVDRNILSPLGDIRANKNFAGTPVVPQSMPDNPKYQYDERTSAIAKVGGQALNISPMQIDHDLISGMKQ